MTKIEIINALKKWNTGVGIRSVRQNLYGELVLETPNGEFWIYRDGEWVRPVGTANREKG